MRGTLAVTGFVCALGFASWLSGETIRAAQAQQHGIQAGTLQRSLVAAIKNAEANAAQRHLPGSETESLVHDTLQAAIIQSGDEPKSVLAALNNLPPEVLAMPRAKAAIAALKSEIEALAAQAKDTGAPNATGGPNQAPAIILVPPPSTGGGGGGGSDYRPG